jgi:exopolyphosphatase/guanosine-5'-triphosphate,3'-diphosphate pyrophosphatase
MRKERKNRREPSRKLVAVIDMGTSSVRMAIAEIDGDGGVRTLESLQQAVSVGKDTFTKGDISRTSTEACVKVLRSFRRIMDEYDIRDPRQIHAVATSAVREASNRQAFLDRIYMATGIDIRTIDEAEVNRYTYLSVLPLLEREKKLRNGQLLLVEIGGGSTELLMIENRQVAFSHTYRLGSLRMRQMLLDFRAPAARIGNILNKHIHGIVAQIPSQIPVSRDTHMLAIGGDARFAAMQLLPDWDRIRPAMVDVKRLSRLAGKIIHQPVDELIRRYHLSYPDAETLGPALLSYVHLAEVLGMKRLMVAGETLRDGLLLEMGAHGSWSPEYSQQVIRSALELGRKYNFDQPHAEQVAYLAGILFRAMQEEHQLPEKYEMILTTAALLHEIGRFISERSHHKHSMYLIQNSDLFGVGTKDLNMMALVARYHRKAEPRAGHSLYDRLPKDGRVAVCKMAAILRVADALDAGHAQRIRNLQIRIQPDTVLIRIRNVLDLSLEKIAMQRKRKLFETVYGKRVVLRAVKKGM